MSQIPANDKMATIMLVNLFATLRQAAGQKTVELSLPDGSTLAQAIQALTTEFPVLQANLLDGDDRLLGHVRIFVNGRDVAFVEEAMDMYLKADDKLDLFPAIAGGTLR